MYHQCLWLYQLVRCLFNKRKWGEKMKKGDYVQVKNWGDEYTTYTDWFIVNKIDPANFTKSSVLETEIENWIFLYPKPIETTPFFFFFFNFAFILIIADE